MNKIKGFTLIELIVVIAITGVIAAAITVFLKSPVFSYNQVAERSEIADETYTVIKKIKQDIRMSLPNSIRVTTVGNKVFLEMLTISNGGKYRSQNNNTLNGDVLTFNVADTSFDILSSPITFTGGEKIVIANIGSVNFDAYSYDNMSDYSGVLNTPLTNIVITSKKFPLESITENFYVVDKVLTYMCDKDAKRLVKYWNYTISSIQPSNNLIAPLSNGNSTMLTNNITDCNFIYDQGENSRNGIVTIIIRVGNNSQGSTLYGESYVPNI